MVLPVETTEEFPPPLDFFVNDKIHPANRDIIEQEQRRYRLLGRLERWRMERFVGQLRRTLQRGKYNQHVLALEALRPVVREAKADYKAAVDRAEKVRLRRKVEQIIAQAREHARALAELRQTYEDYQHFRGWLLYEAEHRAELARVAKVERRNRRLMEKEAAWIEGLIRDVWRQHPSCHYIKKLDGGRERCIVPRIERSIIKPDCHIFYLAASKRWLFGWQFLLPRGVTVEDLTAEPIIKNMRAATRRQVDIIWTEFNQCTIRVARLDAPDALPKSVQWRDIMPLFPQQDRQKLPYCVGVNEERKGIWFNFASAHHILIAGKSGSGKSNVVNSIVGTLASVYSPDELRLVMVDMKGGVEFGHWHELPHVWGDVVKTIDGVKPLLERLVALIDRRYELMEKVKAKDFDRYNKRVPQGDRFPRILVLCDELNTFVGLRGETDDIHNKIMLIVSKGRACGINFIGATQHPDKDTVPGRIKTNMDVRLCGFMPSVVASHIVLDGPEAANIANLPGRFVAQRGLETRTVQVPLITDDDIAGIVSSCQRTYTEVSDTLPEMRGEPVSIVWDEQRLIEASIEWFNGNLAAQKIDEMLGSEESPGQRELYRLRTAIIEKFEANGYVVRQQDGSRWKLKKGKGGARILTPFADSAAAESDISTVSSAKKTGGKRAKAAIKATENAALPDVGNETDEEAEEEPAIEELPAAGD